MAKIARKIMKIFGSTSGSTQVGVIGSYAAGSIAYSQDPAVIQSLSNYLAGWPAVVAGSNSPAIEDMNALCFLYAYQLAYLMQEGVAEWDATTTYYIGSIVQNGTGQLYVSLIDTNLNNALTVSTAWRSVIAPSKQTFTATGTFTAPTGVTNVRVLGIQDKFPVTTQKQNELGQNGLFMDPWGSVYTVGFGIPGLLGDGTGVTKSSPVLVVGGLTFDKVVAGGNSNILGLTKAGQIWGWGANGEGELGDGTLTARSSPVLALGSLKFKDVVVGATHTMGLSSAGLLYSWGQNQTGQLGDGTIAVRSTPVAVVGGLSFKQVFASNPGTGQQVCAGITTAGTLYTWGYNAGGELGDGTVLAKSSPVLVLGGLSFATVTFDATIGGGIATYGLTTTGQLYAWGGNQSGELGDGTVLARSSPVAVLGGLVFTEVFGGANNAYALDATGKLYAWGRNGFGELGDGTTVAKSSPVAVLGGLSFSQVRAGYDGGFVSTILGLTTSGQIYGWGNNSVGQIGDGTSASHSSPALVVGGLLWKNLAIAGNSVVTGSSAYALATTGRLYSWGGNAIGQLGDGTVVAKSSPVLVLGNMQFASGESQVITEITTVPGTAYAINLDSSVATFNNQPVGLNVNRIVVEYQQ